MEESLNFNVLVIFFMSDVDDGEEVVSFRILFILVCVFVILWELY